MKFFLLIMGFMTVSYELMAAVPKSDSFSFATQIQIAKSTSQPMSQRWQALLNAAEVAQYNQIEEIKKFVNSKEWFMRNAALLALQKVNLNYALEEAQHLLKDKALVVRSASVDILAQKMTRENRDLLAKELAKPYNFSKKQSLWIRSKIFNLISTTTTLDDREFLAKSLFDSDEKIKKMAADQLERVTDIHFDEKTKINQWREYVKKNSWL